MRTLCNLLFFVFMATGVSSCQETKSEKKESNAGDIMEKYEWRATESAPKLYPIEVVNGSLTSTSDMVSTAIPKGATMYAGWGTAGSLWITGERLKRLPDKLNITWLSFTEKKFYSGSFDLPIEKLATLFKKGAIDNRGILENYHSIKVGMGPNGIVSVWISCAASTIEVANFQATETTMTMKAFHPGGVSTLEEYLSLSSSFPEEVKEIMNVGLADTVKEQWEGYRKKYEWRPKFESEKEAESHDFYIRYFNGEHIYTTATNPLITAYEYRAVPKSIALHWSDQKGFSYKAEIAVDENEVFDAFASFNTEDDSSKIDLTFRIDKYNSTISVYLDNGTKRIELKNATIKAFPTN